MNIELHVENDSPAAREFVERARQATRKNGIELIVDPILDIPPEPPPAAQSPEPQKPHDPMDAILAEQITVAFGASAEIRTVRNETMARREFVKRKLRYREGDKDGPYMHPTLRNQGYENVSDDDVHVRDLAMQWDDGVEPGKVAVTLRTTR